MKEIHNSLTLELPEEEQEKIPYTQEVPYIKIKELVWAYMTSKSLEKSYMYQPKFLQFKIIYNHDDTFEHVEKHNNIYKIDNHKINIDEKIVYDNKVFFNNKEYNINDISQIEEYIPTYLYNEIKPNKNYTIVFESVVEYLRLIELNTRYEDITNPNSEYYWPFLTRDEYNEIIRFITNGQIPDNYRPISKIISDSNIFLRDYIENVKNIDNHVKETDYIKITTILSKGDRGNNYINLRKVYETLKLTEDMPFIGVTYDNLTKLKIHKDFNDKNKIKHWALTKKNNNYSVRFKGLEVKLKIGNLYGELLMLRDGKLLFMIEKPRAAIKENIDVDTLPMEKINEIVNKINESDVFINKPRKVQLLEKPEIHYMNVDIHFNYNLTQKAFTSIVENDSFIRKYILSDVFNELSDDSYIILFFRSLDTSKSYLDKYENSIFSRDTPYFNVNKEQLETEYHILEKTTRNNFKLTIRPPSKYINSSFVEIIDVDNLNKVEIVKFWINYIVTKLKIHIIESETETQINKNKALKSVIGEYNSRECQKERQPSIYVESIHKDVDPKRILNIEGVRIVCESDDHPYPGFTLKNSVPCCFTRDQSKTNKYLSVVYKNKNYMVSPTNYAYNGKNIIFKDEDFYYLEDGELHDLPEKFNNLMKEKEQKLSLERNTLLMDETNFYNLLIVPKGMENVMYVDSKENLKCYNKQKVNYNTYGIPICDNPITQRPKTGLIVNKSKYHITLDNILESKKTGDVPTYILKLIENSFNLSGIDSIVRYGTNKSKKSFIQAVALTLNDILPTLTNLMLNNLTMDIFKSINNGLIYKKLNGDIEKYKNIIREGGSYEYFHEYLKTLYDIEIVIFDYVEQAILCPQRKYKLNTDKKISLILKISDHYEPILFLTENGLSKITNILPNSELERLYNNVCKTYTIEYNKLKNVKYQVINNENIVKYLILDDGFIIPVMVSMGQFPNIETITMNEMKSTHLKTPQYIISLQDKYKDYISIIAKVVKDNKIIALEGNQRSIIPVIETDSDTVDLQVSLYKYEEQKEMRIQEERMKEQFIDRKRKEKEEYHNIKYEFSQYQGSLEDFAREKNLDDFTYKKLKNESKFITSTNVPKSLYDNEYKISLEFTSVNDIIKHLQGGEE